MSNLYLKNPKLVVSLYYDSLIRQIDIHTEELLEKFTDEDLLPDCNYPLESGESEFEDEDEPNTEREDFYEIDFFNDPYIDEYKYDLDESNAIDCTKTLTRTRDHLNTIREQMIEQLTSCQNICMEYLETSLANFKLESKIHLESGDDENEDLLEDLKKKAFEKMFSFVLEIDRVPVKDHFLTRLTENNSLFKLYVIVLDFYLEQKELELLKKFLFGEFMDDLGKLLRENSDEEVSNIESYQKIDLNKSSLLAHLTAKYIHGLVKKTQNQSHIIQISMKELLSINKVVYSYPSEIFNIISIGGLETPIDLLNIKSLEINLEDIPISYDVKGKLLDLSALKNLEYLSLQRLFIGTNAFDGLSRLRKLSLSYCDLSECTNRCFQKLSSLEIFENYQPNNHSHLDFGGFLNIKWLFLSKCIEFEFLNSLNENLIGFELNNSFDDSQRAKSILEKFNHSNIRKLVFSRNRLNQFDLGWVAGLSNLTSLSLMRNHIQEFKKSSGIDFKNLQSLDLSGNPIKSLDEKVFAELTSLKVLDLSSNLDLNLKCGVFRNLKSLEKLFLRNCQCEHYLNQAKSGSFTDLCNLRILDMSFNQIENLDAEIFAYTPKLETLNLSNNMLTLQIGSFLNLKNLKCLNLNENGLENLEEGVFNGLENLETLRLSRNFLSRLDLKVFHRLNQLSKICLKMNLLAEIDPELFESMPDLKQVELSLMSISENNKKQILEHFKNKQNIRFIF